MHTDTPTCTETEKVPLMQTVSISRMNKASPKARTCAEYFSSTRAACEPRVSLLSLGLMDHHGHETPGLELLHPLCREPPAASQPGHFHTHQGQIRATSEPDQGHIRARSGPDQGQIRAGPGPAWCCVTRDSPLTVSVTSVSPTPIRGTMALHTY